MNTALFKDRLAARGLSQTKLAQRLDINPITIIRAMRGDFEPRLGVARRMARELGVTVDALFPDDAAPSPEPTKPRRFRAIPGGAKGTPKRPATTAEAGRAGGRHRPALRLIRGGLRSGTDTERKAA